MKVLKFLFFSILLILFMPFIICAENSIQVIEENDINNYIIDSDYGFTFNLKNTNVNTSNYHLIMSEEDIINQKIFYDKNIDYNNNKFFYLDNESDCSSKKIFVMYNNVGLYKGKKVNLKITVNNCTFGYKNPLDSNKSLYLNSYYYNKKKYRAEKPSIGFDLKNMQVILNGLRSIDLKYEFLNDNGDEINIKGYGTFKNLNFGQALKLGSGIDKAYLVNYNNICTNITDFTCNKWENSTFLYVNKLVTESNYTKYRDLKNTIQAANYNSLDDYKYAWVTLLFSGKEFNLTYYVGKADYLESWWDNKKDYDGFGSGSFKIDNSSLLLIAIQNPSGSSNKTYIEKNEEYTYKISHRVPITHKDNKYISYTIEDDFIDCFSINEKSIKVVNDNNIDVTNNFNIYISKNNNINKVNIDAKAEFLNNNDFYGHEYQYLITIKIKDTSNLKKYLSKNKDEYIIPNSAMVLVKNNYSTESKKTNRIDVAVKLKKELTSVKNTGSNLSYVFTIIGVTLLICAFLIAVLYQKRNKNMN